MMPMMARGVRMSHRKVNLKFPQAKNQNCLTVRLSAIFKLPYMGAIFEGIERSNPYGIRL